MIPLIFLLVSIASCAYPQLKICTSAELLNQQIGLNIGPLVEQTLKKTKIDGPITQKITSPIPAEATLTDIQFVQTKINWSTNVLIPVSQYKFTVKARNASMTISTFLNGHVSLKKINTTVLLAINQMDLQLDMQILPNPAPKGIGFTVNISHIQLDQKSIKITFVNDTIDTVIVDLIVRIIKNSLNSIVNKIVAQQVNPLILNLTSQPAFQDVNINNNLYSFVFQTTELPGFVNSSIFTLTLHINITNLKTGTVSPDFESDQLPDKVFPNHNDFQVVLSSGFIDSLLWLLGDSKALNLYIDNTMLGDSSPIALDTTGLSILIPDLTKYGAGKGLYIRVCTNSIQPELLIRDGRLVGSMPVDVEFIVDLTQNYPTKDVPKCIQMGDCVSAAAISVTALLSASLKTNTQNTVFGSLQTIKIHSVKVKQVINIYQNLCLEI